MKKRNMLIILCLGIFVVVSGCARVAVKNEYQKYTTLYVGWLDLTGQEHGRYGYLNKPDWAREVAHLNIDGLQKYTRDYMKGWDVIGAASQNAAAPRKPEIMVVRLTNPVLNHVTLSLHCGMDFIDGATGKVVKHRVVDTAPMAAAHHPSRWGYVHPGVSGGRLMDIMYNLAYEIQYSLTH
jgi:hypothetical protein